jgi:small subunit ribosomal protein S1
LAAETATYEALNRNAGNDMMNLGDILDEASKKE